MRKPYCIEVWEDGTRVARQWITKDTTPNMEKLHQTNMRRYAESRKGYWEIIYTHVRSRMMVLRVDPIYRTPRKTNAERFPDVWPRYKELRDRGETIEEIKRRLKIGSRFIQLLRHEENKTSGQHT